MRELSQKNMIELAEKAAIMLGVRRKINTIKFTDGLTGWCCVESGDIRYPKYLKYLPNAYKIHYVLHEVLHLKFPEINHEEPFRNMEVRLNKRFGIKLLYQTVYTMALYDLKGELLAKEEWSSKVKGLLKKPDADRRIKQYMKSLWPYYVELEVNWRNVKGTIR